MFLVTYAFTVSDKISTQKAMAGNSFGFVEKFQWKIK